MWKWILCFLLIAVTGWTMLKSSQQMNKADKIIESKLLPVEQAYFDKYDLCGNISNSFKTFANIDKILITQLETARQKAIAQSIPTVTTTSKGPYNFARIQSQLDLAVSVALDTVISRSDLSQDANFKVLFSDFDAAKEKCRVTSAQYNKEVEGHNAVLKKFPNSIYNRIFGYRKRYVLHIAESQP